METNNLSANYENACNDYLRAFCDKHGFDFEDAKTSWVAGEVGEVTCCADCYVDMRTIIADIEQDAPKEEFVKWYDYCLELHSFGATSTPNYKSWLRGCPRKSEAEMEELRTLHAKAEDARAVFLALLNRVNGDERNMF